MRINKKIIETVSTEFLDKLVCNKCGEVINDPHLYGNYFAALYQGGYGSKLGDMTQYSFDICEQCLIEWIENFKYAPNIEYLF